MKSTNNNTNAFSMEDFEKGLMLAGLISPSNATELEEREMLAKHEDNLKEEKKTIYFKRAVLAAEIAHELHNEVTFGRVKFQKLVYLCEHVAEMNLQDRYGKLAAGPFDHKFMHTIELEFKKQKWFEVEKISTGKMIRSVYKPMERVEHYKTYYNSYFGHQTEYISRVINLFRFSKTDKSEIAATLLACRIELDRIDRPYTLNDVISLFYEWSKEKSRFTKDYIISIWRWMVEKNLVVDVLS